MSPTREYLGPEWQLNTGTNSAAFAIPAEAQIEGAMLILDVGRKHGDGAHPDIPGWTRGPEQAEVTTFWTPYTPGMDPVTLYRGSSHFSYSNTLARLSAWTGVNLADPIQAWTGAAQNGTAAPTITGPTVTDAPTVMVVHTYQNDDRAYSGWTAPGWDSITEDYVDQGGYSVGQYRHAGASGPISSPGASGDVSWTLAAAEDNDTVVYALRLPPPLLTDQAWG